MLKKLFQHRFDGDNPLSGHYFGTLFILAMEKITGNFEEALEESCKILNVKGKLIPATLDQINLEAIMNDGSHIIGESSIQENLSGINEGARFTYLNRARINNAIIFFIILKIKC